MSAQPVRDAIDRWQQASPLTAVPCAVAKKFTDDGASRLAALIAYWGFFSIFPLLLAFASILGFLLEDNPDFQKDVLDSTVAQIPVIGEQLKRDVTSLKGSGVALAIGIVGAVWAGLGVTLALGRALDTVWAVRRVDRPDYVHSRLRGLAILVVIGTAQVLTTVVVTLARNGTIQPPAAGIASFAGSAAIDFLVFVTAFRVLTAADVTTRQVLPGAVLATISWVGLQTLGGLYVEHVVAQVERDLRGLRRGHRPALVAVAGRAAQPRRRRGQRRPRPAPVAAVALRRPRGGRRAGDADGRGGRAARPAPAHRRSALTRLRNHRPRLSSDR